MASDLTEFADLFKEIASILEKQEEVMYEDMKKLVGEEGMMDILSIRDMGYLKGAVDALSNDEEKLLINVMAIHHRLQTLLEG